MISIFGLLVQIGTMPKLLAVPVKIYLGTITVMTLKKKKLLTLLVERVIMIGRSHLVIMGLQKVGGGSQAGSMCYFVFNSIWYIHDQSGERLVHNVLGIF